jgi:hypothetical protein
MTRSYTAQNLITLPRLSAAEADVLITQLLAAATIEAKAAKGKELPPPIERSRSRLTVAHVTLSEIVAPQIAADTQAKRKADRWIDSAWSGTFDWLSGWCKLPLHKNPHLDLCKALMELCFAEALGFTKLPYRLEWQQSRLRLDAIAREGHEKTFKQLGGSAFLANLTEAQEGYGVALGITVPAPAEVTGELGTRMLAALAAVRDYVNRVAAYAEPDVPGSDELAEALLLPLSVWEATHRATAQGATEPAAEPAAPAQPAAPANKVS